MLKRTFLISFIIGIIVLLNISVYADEKLNIKDPQLLEALLKYDANENGSIEKSELGDDIVLDGYNITSLSGLQGISCTNLYMRSCGLTELPDKLDKMDWDFLYLNNNEITETEDIKKMLDTRVMFYKEIYLDGNPCYDELIDYLFNEYYNHVSIVGEVGTISWQKRASHNLIVDIMSVYNSDDIFMDYISMDITNSGLDNWIYEIEDTTIAEIGDPIEITRDYETNDHPFHIYNKTSTVIGVKLLKEGHTRMKITSGNYVKYTDIWVLPEGATGTGLYELEYISDPEICKYINARWRPEYSGMYKCKALKRSEQLSIDGNIAKIKDFATFDLFNNLSKITLSNYTNDELADIRNLNLIDSLNEVELVANETQKENIGSLLYTADSIGQSAGWEYVLGAKDDGNIVVVDANSEINNSATDWQIISGIGDINHDVKICASDALIALKKSANLIELTEIQEYLGDVNADGVINSDDALVILQYSAGIIDNLPSEK